MKMDKIKTMAKMHFGKNFGPIIGMSLCVNHECK